MAEADDSASDIEKLKYCSRKKLELEDSFAKKWAPTAITALVTVSVAILTLGINWNQSSIAREDRLRSDEQARVLAEASRKQQEGQWGISVLELYITNPEGSTL